MVFTKYGRDLLNVLQQDKRYSAIESCCNDFQTDGGLDQRWDASAADQRNGICWQPIDTVRQTLADDVASYKALVQVPTLEFKPFSASCSKLLRLEGFSAILV